MSTLVAASACYLSADSFYSRLAKLGCVNYKECSRSEYDKAFDSMGECRDELEPGFSEFTKGCDYDAGKGRKCVHEARKRRKDCDTEDQEPTDKCDKVFTSCPGIDDEPAEDNLVMLRALDTLPAFLRDPFLYGTDEDGNILYPK